MKKLLTTACLSLLLVGAYAQGSPSISQRATEFTRSLAPHVGLDDARQIQVKRLTVSRMEKEQEIDRMYVGDEAVRQPKLQAVAEEYRTNLKSLLTPAQYQRFEQWAATAPANATAAKP
ncbi:hypothetical protein LJ737_18270 [Hymenobacter sp. 15J16-1T3B]|uniref:hypothetical protein n=1 Tax=Hymenobacter sp. 15J16-1T3B TaxID=2886941 RepID=UPI001D1245CD|nr:hypothetical protein [Hymenobacter sp. 15J16-1T3B]MCC3159193.1 hypothetical protein [Hymenobacter sp. 15J16-1T3B]